MKKAYARPPPLSLPCAPHKTSHGCHRRMWVSCPCALSSLPSHAYAYAVSSAPAPPLPDFSQLPPSSAEQDRVG